MTATPIVLVGSFTAQSGDQGISATAETIYAYLGSDVNAPTTFLTAITNNGSFTVATGGLTGTTLTAGTNAVAITASTDFGQYTKPRNDQTTFAAYGPIVNTPGNWTVDVGGDSSAFVPNTTPFTLTAVPEASAFMAVGLALTSAVVVYPIRRRFERKAGGSGDVA